MLKTLGFGAVLEVQMLTERMGLWWEAHFEVNMLEAPHVLTTLDVESHGLTTTTGCVHTYGDG